MAADLQQLEEALSALLEAIGVDLVDLEVRQGTLCVTVRRPDGLDLESLTEASRAVSDFLDAHEDLTPAEPFELEVSSPGLERRLRRPEHFADVIGETVALRTIAGTPGARRVEGELVSADPSGIAIRPKDSPSIRALAYGEIDRAHTVFDWKAALASEKRSRPDRSEMHEGSSVFIDEDADDADITDELAERAPQRESTR